MNFWIWLARLFIAILCPRCGAKCASVKGLPGQYRCPDCGEIFYR